MCGYLLVQPPLFCTCLWPSSSSLVVTLPENQSLHTNSNFLLLITDDWTTKEFFLGPSFVWGFSSFSRIFHSFGDVFGVIRKTKFSPHGASLHRCLWFNHNFYSQLIVTRSFSVKLQTLRDNFQARGQSAALTNYSPKTHIQPKKLSQRLMGKKWSPN